MNRHFCSFFESILSTVYNNHREHLDEQLSKYQRRRTTRLLENAAYTRVYEIHRAEYTTRRDSKETVDVATLSGLNAELWNGL